MGPSSVPSLPNGSETDPDTMQCVSEPLKALFGFLVVTSSFSSPFPSHISIFQRVMFAVFVILFGLLELFFLQLIEHILAILGEKIEASRSRISNNFATEDESAAIKKAIDEELKKTLEEAEIVRAAEKAEEAEALKRINEEHAKEVSALNKTINQFKAFERVIGKEMREMTTRAEAAEKQVQNLLRERQLERDDLELELEDIVADLIAKKEAEKRRAEEERDEAAFDTLEDKNDALDMDFEKID